MFSDDFWSEPDQKRNAPTQITLSSFFTRIAAAMQTILAAKHAPDYLDQDALGDRVTFPEEISKAGHCGDSVAVIDRDRKHG
jgi:hypothetical protein